jgi:hypothetical protein
MVTKRTISLCHNNKQTKTTIMKTLTASELTGKTTNEQKKMFLEVTKDLNTNEAAEIAKKIEEENNDKNFGDVVYAENLVYTLLLTRKFNLDFSFEFGNLKELRKLGNREELIEEAKKLTA